MRFVALVYQRHAHARGRNPFAVSVVTATWHAVNALPGSCALALRLQPKWRTSMSQHDKDEVWAFVQEMNRAWTVDGKPERLVDYFAPEMVAITPTDRFRREGQAACVAG